MLWPTPLPATLLLLALTPDTAAPAHKATQAEYRDSLRQASALVHACSAASAACDSGKAGSDLLVGTGAGTYTVHYDWLRAEISAAHSATPDRRIRMMQATASRLEQELAALDAAPEQDSRARSAANRILARSEFRAVDASPSPWQRLSARFWAWLDRVLFLAASASAQRPWIGVALEWALLVGALAGLLTYVFRSLRQERGPRMAAWKPQFAGNPAEPNWAAMAETAAAAGEWREAVHALYWAAVASLATAGRWRASAAAPRTPREYLRLLEPGTPQRSSLAALTALLERVWYGRRAAGEREYREALALADQLCVPTSARA